MARETERKFLIREDGWRPRAQGSRHIVQGYLALDTGAEVRVRIIDDSEAVMTVKSADSALSRHEFEYPVPIADAHAMLALCSGRVIDKQRHIVPAADGLRWEIDEFAGPLSGLLLAEIELVDALSPFERPEWLGAEVTGDPRFYNARLALAEAPPATT